MSIHVWLLFCATETILCLTPGPAVLLVVSRSLSRGAKAGLSASLGIVAANTAYFALSATSLGALLVASSRLFIFVKWIGAAYLIVVGARMVVSRPTETPAVEEASRRSNDSSFSLAVLTQGANPKALVFFTAILPQFISPESPMLRQIVILGLSSIVIEFSVLSAYVAVCHRARSWAGQPRFAIPLQRMGGAFLIGAGARLAVIARS